MFGTISVALAVAASLFIVYLVAKAYYPSWFGASPPPFQVPTVVLPPTTEPFVAPKASGPPVETGTNSPMPPVPAPAPPLKQDPPEEKRVVSPGGPNPPNARAPEDTVASLSPDVKPIDPYDDSNMEAPIHDSMRHPELSFGPGVENTGMNKLATSGVGSTQAMAAESPFSPEFAQNGGGFMGSVFANDLSKDDRFASA